MNDRRTFLKNVGGATAAAAAVSTLTQQTAEAATVELKAARSYSDVKFALQLDGSFAGWLSSAEGGHAVGEVVTEKLGPDRIARKHIAGVKYEEITVQCGTGMTKAFYDWIKASLDNKFVRKNGAIVTADFKLQSLSTLSFFNAALTELTMPELDASSKEPAYMTLKFAPEFTRREKASGKLQGDIGKTPSQKAWLPSNFRLTIDGLEAPASKVSKVDAINIKQTFTDSEIGGDREFFKEPGKIEFPNLKFTLSEAFADDFFKWHDDFVIKGNNSQESERSGKLEFLSPDRKTTLFTLTLHGLGIFKCAPESKHKDESGNTATVRAVNADVYVEKIGFDYLGGGQIPS